MNDHAAKANLYDYLEREPEAVLAQLDGLTEYGTDYLWVASRSPREVPRGEHQGREGQREEHPSLRD